MIPYYSAIFKLTLMNGARSVLHFTPNPNNAPIYHAMPLSESQTRKDACIMRPPLLSSDQMILKIPSCPTYLGSLNDRVSKTLASK